MEVSRNTKKKIVRSLDRLLQLSSRQKKYLETSKDISGSKLEELLGMAQKEELKDNAAVLIDEIIAEDVSEEEERDRIKGLVDIIRKITRGNVLDVPTQLNLLIFNIDPEELEEDISSINNPQKVKAEIDEIIENAVNDYIEEDEEEILSLTDYDIYTNDVIDIQTKTFYKDALDFVKNKRDLKPFSLETLKYLFLTYLDDEVKAKVLYNILRKEKGRNIDTLGEYEEILNQLENKYIREYLQGYQDADNIRKKEKKYLPLFKEYLEREALVNTYNYLVGPKYETTAIYKTLILQGNILISDLRKIVDIAKSDPGEAARIMDLKAPIFGFSELKSAEKYIYMKRNKILELMEKGIILPGIVDYDDIKGVDEAKVIEEGNYSYTDLGIVFVISLYDPKLARQFIMEMVAGSIFGEMQKEIQDKLRRQKIPDRGQILTYFHRKGLLPAKVNDKTFTKDNLGEEIISTRDLLQVLTLSYTYLKAAYALLRQKISLNM